LELLLKLPPLGLVVFPLPVLEFPELLPSKPKSATPASYSPSNPYQVPKDTTSNKKPKHPFNLQTSCNDHNHCTDLYILQSYGGPRNHHHNI
jgi:hypothetical protein